MIQWRKATPSIQPADESGKVFGLILVWLVLVLLSSQRTRLIGNAALGNVHWTGVPAKATASSGQTLTTVGVIALGGTMLFTASGMTGKIYEVLVGSAILSTALINYESILGYLVTPKKGAGA